MEPQSVWERALEGDLRRLASLEDGASPIWQVAAQTLRRFAARCPGIPLDVTSLSATSGFGEEGTIPALELHGRRALLSLNHLELAKTIEVLSAMATPETERIALRFRGWQQAFLGDGTGAAETGRSLYAQASAAGAAVDTVEAVTLQSLAAMVSDDSAEALHLARRAAHMAQSEHLWVSHYQASLLLARARRLSRQPHLASRIVTSCLRVAGSEWHGWLHWERVFAGAAYEASDGPVEDTILGVDAAKIEAWSRGAGSAASPHPSIRASALHASDHFAASRALDPAAAPLDDAVGDWIRGSDPAIPSALCGLAASAANAHGAWVLARKGHPARRILGVPPQSAAQVAPSGAQPTRVDTIIAALVLAPKGIERAELFQAAYGFPYRAAIHEPTFKVLRSQAKRHIANAGAIRSVDQKYTLDVLGDFVIVDPRSEQPLQEVMLRYLGRTGRAGAKDVAARLSVPLRTVQQALKGLVEDGACAISKEGRRVQYVVEDTVFCELTIA